MPSSRVIALAAFLVVAGACNPVQVTQPDGSPTTGTTVNNYVPPPPPPPGDPQGGPGG